MSEEEHRKSHAESHVALDGLVAEFLLNTGRLPSKATITELLEWSYRQTSVLEDYSERKKEGGKDKKQHQEYKVVAHDVGVCLNDFMLEVNTWMKEEWVPQGGIAILEDQAGRNYMYQAMIKL